MQNTFDKQDRLTQVIVDGKTVQYRYNGDGLLIERSYNGEVTRYYYDGGSIIAEATVVNGAPTLKASYIRGNKLEAIQYGNGTKAYVQYNGHGDIVELRDKDGAILNQYSYDIWGNPIIEEETVHNPFRYSGELWDDTTNLQYLRARWYDPSIGRFMNEDTYEGEINNPLSLNLYTYVHNNPLRYVDPSGHDAIIITNPDLAFGFGHTSLIIQNAKGEWSYFYYGDKSVQFEKVDPSALLSLKEFNEWGRKQKLSGFGEIESAGYTLSTYIQGDFTKSYLSAEEMVKTYNNIKKTNGDNPEYNLITCSCHTNSKDLLSMGVLYNGVSMERFMATLATNEIKYGGMSGFSIPNIGHSMFSKTFYNNAFTKKEYREQLEVNLAAYNDANWVLKKITKANFHMYRINILLGQTP
ncbi:RHS repeat domain-containing protein [Paenibacillus sp. IITD108]|uniref:RHS repeat domain-containing protein n=1 Tax=Paenibacillus sp. IITD108 TaxID=3116649 RepID=UPI002F416846